jgi:hypothetical protein
MQRKFLLSAAMIVIAVLFSTPGFSQSSDDFTIAALPDTQFYSKSYPQIFAAETQWIANHAAAMNIKLVIGLGVIVDGGGELTQWQNADAAYRIIDRKIPFLPAIGNHDYDRNNPAGRTGSTTNYNSYYGPARFSDRTWYKGNFPAGSNENFYGVFTFGSRKYLVVVLEVFPRDVSLQWAASVIQSHPDYDVIVVTHAYTYADNTRLDHCDENSAASFAVGQDNDGEQIWEKLVSKYPNIVMVLSGHVVEGDGTGRRSDLGDHGNLVSQILSDYQSYANGGDGYIRLITVRPSADQIVVKTYSPYLNSYLTDDHNQFTMTYKNNGSVTPAMGQISGWVKNVADCTMMSSVNVSASSGSSVTGADGKFTITAPGPAAYGLSVSRVGFGVANNRSVASVVPSQPSPAKIFMSTEGYLQGIVTVNGAPLANAKVLVSGGALRTWTTVTSGGDGSFVAGWLPFGTYQITATTTDGTTVQSTASIQIGATTKITISK